MTNHLERRIQQHREGIGSAFTKKYKLSKLVYWEHTVQVDAAIRREKQLKGWTRTKKETLIEQANPAWRDLAAEWRKDSSAPPCGLRSE